MDPVLADLYTNVSSAPYLIAAYALLWAVLLVFVGMLLARIKKTQKDIDALKDAIEYREEKEGSAKE